MFWEGRTSDGFSRGSGAWLETYSAMKRRHGWTVVSRTQHKGKPPMEGPEQRHKGSGTAKETPQGRREPPKSHKGGPPTEGPKQRHKGSGSTPPLAGGFTHRVLSYLVPPSPQKGPLRQPACWQLPRLVWPAPFRLSGDTADGVVRLLALLGGRAAGGLGCHSWVLLRVPAACQWLTLFQESCVSGLLMGLASGAVVRCLREGGLDVCVNEFRL